MQEQDLVEKGFMGEREHFIAILEALQKTVRAWSDQIDQIVEDAKH